MEYTFENPEYRDAYRHTVSHMLAQAVKRLYPTVKLAIGPSIENGFYYDFDADFAITPEMLEEIEKEMRAIAKEMGRSASTLSREVARNATRYDGFYRPSKAQVYAIGRRRRCRRRSRYTVADWAWIDTLLWMKWSPEQIARTLGLTGEVSICHETIYRRIRRDRLKGGHLWLYTRIMSKFARKRYRGRSTRGILAGKRHISARPKEVEGRQRLGHWEGDTVMGSDKRHCVLTLVERKSGFAIVKKLSTRSMLETTQAALMALAEHGKRIKTITFDNGTEFHDYATLEQIYPVKCYFATPYHSWA